MKKNPIAARVKRPLPRLPISGFLLLACAAMPLAAHAQGGSPFDSGMTAIQTLFTGTIAKVSSLIAIVIGGYSFAHGEPKSGDLGVVLEVCGVDFESLDQAGQEFAVRRLEAALKSFGPGFHVYQYLFKTNRPDIPFAKYGDSLIHATVEQRREFFEAKRDRLYCIEIFYAVVLEGARSKTGIGAAIGRFPSDPNGAWCELKAQFTGDSMKILLRTQIERDHALTIVLYDPDRATVEHEVSDFAAIFTNQDGLLFPETYNQLNALFAVVPGNYAQNLRKMYLLLSNYADLSFFFTVLQGEKCNHHLGTEYLAVLETDNATPYYLNLHNGEVAHTLILGMTGSGKSFLCNFLLTNAQKYKPLTYIFDIGGSFQSLTEIFGGSYLTVGQESRDSASIRSRWSQPKKTCNSCFLFSVC